MGEVWRASPDSMWQGEHRGLTYIRCNESGLWLTDTKRPVIAPKPVSVEFNKLVSEAEKHSSSACWRAGKRAEWAGQSTVDLSGNSKKVRL